MTPTNNRKTAWAVLAATLITLLLYWVPALHLLAYPFLLLSTFVHEMGHGITAVLLGGHFHSLQIWADGSGVALYSGQFGAFAQALVAAGGLLGPVVAATLGFWALTTQQRARYCLGVIGLGAMVAIVLVVRNVFGFAYVAVFGVLCLLFAFGQLKQYAQFALAFLAAQLAVSVFARMDYLFQPVAHTSAGLMPSDVQQIANALWLPYWLWGAILAALSVLVLALGLRRLFLSLRR